MIIGVVLAALAIITSALAVTVAIAGSRQAHVNASTLSSSSPQPSLSPSSSSPQPSPSPTPTSLTARSEATAISNLLSSSARSRSALLNGSVVPDVGECINISNDIQQLQQIASQRMRQYNQARNLQTGAVQNGGMLKSELVKALLDSLDADNDFLRWAQQQKKSRCAFGYSSAYFDEGNASDKAADHDKGAFLSVWNTVAQQYHLRQFLVDQI